jgi:RimJ/RimL family protein N-acetyltransferase
VREVIFTKRLVLRKIEENDLDLLVYWSKQKDAYGDYLSREDLNKEDAVSKFNNNYFWNDMSKIFIIQLKEAQPIGTIQYWKKQESSNESMVSLKIVDPKYRGKGLGTEAQVTFITFLFKDCSYRAIEMVTDIDNVAEQKCLLKLGFSLTDNIVYKDVDINRNGNKYRLTQEDFLNNDFIKYYNYV